MPPTVFFLLRIDLAMRALFWFHVKFKVVFSSFFVYYFVPEWYLPKLCFLGYLFGYTGVGELLEETVCPL